MRDDALRRGVLAAVLGRDSGRHLPVADEAAVGDLHNQDGPLGMGLPVITPRPRDHGSVRLRLRFVVESDGRLPSDDPATRKGFSQRVLDQAHRRRMRTVLRLGDEQLAADQLDSVAWLKETTLDEPLVLDA